MLWILKLVVVWNMGIVVVRLYLVIKLWNGSSRLVGMFCGRGNVYYLGFNIGRKDLVILRYFCSVVVLLVVDGGL